MNRALIKPVVAAFFDKRTCCVQYVVSCPDTRRCAVIDPVLDFEPKSGATATYSADAILEHMRSERLGLDWVLDTHPHADHFSAAGYLKDKTGARAATGEKVVEVQRLWKSLYNLPDSFRTDGSQWDKLFADGERFSIGNLTCEVMLSPGHTLASITYVVSDAAFVHDTLSMPDGGTARCDFPELSGTPSNASSHCLMTHACSPGTTTCRAVVNRNGRARSRGRRPRTFTCAGRQQKMNSCLFGRSKTERCRCRSSSFQ